MIHDILMITDIGVRKPSQPTNSFSSRTRGGHRSWLTVLESCRVRTQRCWLLSPLGKRYRWIVMNWILTSCCSSIILLRISNIRLMIRWSSLNPHLMHSKRRSTATNQQHNTTLKQRKIFGIHIIQNTMTLTETSIKNEKRYRFVELRTATVPTTWDKCMNWVKVFELIATLYVSNIYTSH